MLKEEQLMQYWQAMADNVLPFLQNRFVTVEQQFNDYTVYRRYVDKQKHQQIRIKTIKDINAWAYKHTYSFHPYIVSTNLDKCFYALDIDPKGSDIDFEEVKNVAIITYKILKEWKIHFMVKFCGNNGFHFMWIWKNRFKTEQELYSYNQSLSVTLLKAVLSSNCSSPVLPSDKRNKSVIVKEYYNNISSSSAIIFDTKIMHKHGNIRSPFSVHPKTGLVSVPIKSLNDLHHFQKGMAKPNVVTKMDWKWLNISNLFTNYPISHILSL